MVTGFVERIVGRGPAIDPEEAKLRRYLFGLNVASLLMVVAHGGLFFLAGYRQAAAILAVSCVGFLAAGALMHRGRISMGRMIQHTTGLAGTAAFVVMAGPAVGAHLGFLLAAQVALFEPPGRGRYVPLLHVGAAIALWALVESGMLDALAVMGDAGPLVTFLRFELGVLIMAGLAFTTSESIREHRDTEGRLEEANAQLLREARARERLEKQLAEAKARALLDNQAKDDFLASMSHEIRTPMNTIIGLSRIVAHNALEPQVRDYIQRVRSSSSALLGIINDILDLSRIEAREVELDDVPFELWEVLDRLTELIGDGASAKGLGFRVLVDPDVPRTLQGDPLRLGQVLTNLANNAVKFTADGEVTVRVRLARQDHEKVRLAFAVEDTGIGIPSQMTQKLFGSFVHADGSTTRRFGGSGLGLTISQSLVGLMGGIIRVDSEVGHGSRFSFEASFRTAKETRGGRTAIRELQGLEVLVLHNHVPTSEALCSMLASLGFKPLPARTDQEVRHALATDGERERSIGLILVDWPDGIEVCREVCRLPALAQVPTVLMIAPQHLDAVSGIASQTGVTGVLLKPIRATALLEVVADVLGGVASMQGLYDSSGFLPSIQRILGVQVLVAEDDEANGEVAKGILEGAGLRVTLVRDGEEAIREASRRAYDLVLMDAHMPKLDGLAATAVLRAQPETARLPIVAMTADAQESTRVRCLAAGMDEFVSKPISVSDLLSKILKLVGSERRTAESRAPERVPPPRDPAEHVVAESPAPEPLESASRGWFDRLMSHGVPEDASPQLSKRIRLTNGIVLGCIVFAAASVPVLLAVGLEVAAMTTGAMALLWPASLALVHIGRHRAGRLAAFLIGFAGCTATALVLGPRSDYQVLLFPFIAFAAILLTTRERRWGQGLAVAVVCAWFVVESGVVTPVEEISDGGYLILHASAGALGFGLLIFSIRLLVRENRERERRLIESNEKLRREIAERKAAELALVEARDAAEDASVAKSEFLANMSHEIRTPMNAILGMTELCLRAGLSSDIRGQVEKIHSSARALLRTINDVLDLSRLDANKIEVEQIAFDLWRVLDNVTGAVGPVASDKGLELLVVAEPDVPARLRGDPLRIEQVLVNLAENAVAATRKGVVAVRISMGKSGAHAVRFEVFDTGAGFPYASVEAYFEARAADSRVPGKRRPGQGLGLALCQRLVGVMGGRLQVRSDGDDGSMFWFELALGMCDKEPESWSPGTGERVLVVSGQPIALRTICGWLASWGYAPTPVSSSREAQRQLAGDKPYPVVLIDWPARGAKAIEVVPNLDDIPVGAYRVLLATELDRSKTVPSRMIKSVDAVLAKPVRRDALYDAIQVAIGGARLDAFEHGIPPELRSALRGIRGARVLVVEDNEANQLVAKSILEAAALEVGLARNGSEALRVLSESFYDLVLMDLHMPKMDGYEATRRLREDPKLSKLPILAMTADTQRDTREACLEAGMNGHVSKPVDRVELLAALLPWIEATRRSVKASVHASVVPASKEPSIPSKLDGVDLDDALERASGSEEVLARVFAAFRRHYQGLENEVEQAWRRGDVKRANGLVHSIKGSAGTIGARELYEASVRLEDALREGTDETIADRLEAHRKALQRVMRSLETVSIPPRPASDPPPAPEGPDPQTLQADLVELARLLSSGDLAAQELASGLLERCGQSAMRDDVQAIAEHVDYFEFDAAMEKVLELGRKWEIDLGG